MKKKAVIIHSGGMDSSLCLALAIKEFGADQVCSLSFSYDQRHGNEIQAAKKICSDWSVDHDVVNVDVLSQVTHNALLDKTKPIEYKEGFSPNTLVLGRNGLMARLGAIYAHHKGAHSIWMGVMEFETHYRDCSRRYMDLMQEVLQLDLDDPSFEIRTPLVHMTKLETIQLADELGIFEYLFENTISCYEGIPGQGCSACPACKLRNQAIQIFSHT